MRKNFKHGDWVKEPTPHADIKKYVDRGTGKEDTRGQRIRKEGSTLKFKKPSAGGPLAGRSSRKLGKGSEDKKKKKKIYKYKSKDKRFTDKQASMHMDIKEKSHGHYPKSYFAKQLKKDKHGRFRGKVYDAPPTTLVKAGMTGKHGKVGLPIHGISSTHTKGKLTDFKVTPYSGSVKTGFKGYDMKDPSKKGFKKGGRAGFQHGGRTNLYEELGRVEAEPSNRNRRAEVSRIHSELNKGYSLGGRVGIAERGFNKKILRKD